MPFNQEIYYQIFEPKKSGSKELNVVFLHGMGGDSNALIPLIEEAQRLMPQARFIMFDARGHGDSTLHFPKSSTDPLTTYAEDLYHLCKKLKISDPIFIGHCLGGIVLQEYAQHNFSIIPKKYIIICSSLKIPNLSFFRLHWFKFFKYISPLLPIKTKKRTVKEHQKFADSHDYNLFRIWGDVKTMGGFIRWILSYFSILGWENNSAEPINRSNNTFIYGKRDMVFPLFLEKRNFHKIINCKKIFLDTNHIAPISNHKLLAKVISEEITTSFEL